MAIEFLMLLTLSTTTFLGVPLYLYFREKMLLKKSKINYTRKRIIKLTLVNIFLTLFVTMQLLGVLIGILLRDSSYTVQAIFLSSLFILVICLVFYGAGMYISSIVIEAYTSPILRKHKSFLTQYAATQLFHGPASHILVYGGCVIALFVLSILDLARPNQTDALTAPIIIGLGMLTGIFFTASQIYNKTYLYQLIVVSICISLLSLLSFNKNINITFTPIFSFFFSFCIAFVIAISFYIWYKSFLKNVA